MHLYALVPFVSSDLALLGHDDGLGAGYLCRHLRHNGFFAFKIEAHEVLSPFKSTRDGNRSAAPTATWIRSTVRRGQAAYENPVWGTVCAGCLRA